MDFTEVISKRRMVRNYTDEPVDPAALQRILDAGVKAPSAGFSQGHSFVVVARPGVAEATDSEPLLGPYPAVACG